MHVRADLLQAFNEDIFTIILKPRRVETSEYVVHAITGNDPEFCVIYHNRPAVNVENVCRQCLLARFARTVMPLASPFIVAGTRRRVVLVDVDFYGRASWGIEEMSGSTLAKHYGYPNPMSLKLSPGADGFDSGCTGWDFGSTRLNPRVPSVTYWGIRSALARMRLKPWPLFNLVIWGRRNR